jgi:hypothetical protein
VDLPVGTARVMLQGNIPHGKCTSAKLAVVSAFLERQPTVLLYYLCTMTEIGLEKSVRLVCAFHSQRPMAGF